jgi:hypothetical protein
MHGEYSAALGDLARVFSTSPQSGQNNLYVPFWALEAGELLDFIAGSLSETQHIAFTDKIQELKEKRVGAGGLPGIELSSLTMDSPIPFSLKRLWYELIDFEITTYGGAQRDEPQLVEKGDPETLTPPKYKPHAMGSAGPYLNQHAKGIRRQLNLMRSRLLDRRYDFILHPGEWAPDQAGFAPKDLDSLLGGWLGHDRPLTILDLSGVPSAVLNRLVGSILRIVLKRSIGAGKKPKEVCCAPFWWLWKKRTGILVVNKAM